MYLWLVNSPLEIKRRNYSHKNLISNESDHDRYLILYKSLKLEMLSDFSNSEYWLISVRSNSKFYKTISNRFRFHLEASSEMFHIRHYIFILFVLLKFSTSEIVTLHGPDNTLYTYDNSCIMDSGVYGAVYIGLWITRNCFLHIRE